MSASYIIILSDSEDEYENVPMSIPEPDSSNESSSSEPMEEDEIPALENIVVENEEPSEEEDPSEDDPSEAPLVETASETLSPPPHNVGPSFVSGARTIYTARKQVPIPRRQMTSSSGTSTPSIDPYIAPNSTTHRRADARRWTWLPEKLQTWREDEGFPIITEEGESSSSRDFPLTREPPHHTVPLLVARLVTQELRIDHLEDATDELPGAEAYENLGGEVYALSEHVETVQDKISSLEEQLVELGEANQEMASREVYYIGKIQSLESRMAQRDQDMIRMQGHIDHLTAMANASFERDAMAIRGGRHP